MREGDRITIETTDLAAGGRRSRLVGGEAGRPMVESHGVSIRPYKAGDGPLFHAAVIESMREVHPWMAWCHEGFSLDHANAWVELQIDAFAKGLQFEFIVIDGSGTFLGACGLNQLDEANRRANLGYWIRTSASRKGYATAAVRLLSRWAHENTKLQRLELVVAVGNEASLRVAAKAGAFREGVVRSRLFVHGTFHDAVLFSLIRGENMAD